MPLVTKNKPAKNKKTEEIQNESIENSAFKTGIFGFKRAQVNLFVNGLKKKIRALEKEKEELLIENADIGGSEKERLSEHYERQILDLTEKLNNEKNTSAMLEKECMRLQGDIENLNTKLIKKGGSSDNSDSADLKITKAYLSSSITKKLNVINEEINKIKSEFMVDENELIISLPEDSQRVHEKPSFSAENDFDGLKFEYPKANTVPVSFEEENILLSSSSETTYTESGFTDFSDTVEDMPESLSKAEEELDSALLIQQNKPAVTEILPNTKLYEQSSNSFDEILMNSEKVEKDDEFADILFRKSNEYKVKGEDLIALNPALKDSGDDLIAGNPTAVDRGEDLGEDEFDLYVNDSNILIDEDNKFYSGEYNEDDYESNSPEISRLGFIGMTDESDSVKAFGRPNRLKNIADDMEMSSSMDISDFLL